MCPTERTLPLLVLLAFMGCGKNDATGPHADCVRACMAHSLMGSAKVCGTDGITYDECQADCASLPDGIGFYPGACQADGSPAPGAPREPADGQSVCGYVKVGSGWGAVECKETLDQPFSDVGSYLGDKDGSDFEVAEGALPDEVDHRSRFAVAKNQGQVGACTSFGMTAALEAAIRSTIGEKVSLSEMHLWSRYHTPSTADCVAAAQQGGIARVEDASASGLPFSDLLAQAWQEGESTPDPVVLDKLDALAAFEVAAVDALTKPAGRSGPTVEQLQHALAAGSDLYVAMGVVPQLWGNPQNGIIPDYDWTSEAAHAVAFIGYKRMGGRLYFLLRNSWGADWAEAGYAYVSSETVDKNIQDAAAVAVRRLEGPDTAPDCPPGESADLADTCRTVCTDGSLADPAGACGTQTATCAAGQVADAGGQCVAPCASATRTYTGMTVECQDRACTWHIDNGVMGCTAGPGKQCDKTCPAPTCAVVTRQNELGHTVWGCAAALQ